MLLGFHFCKCICTAEGTPQGTSKAQNMAMSLEYQLRQYIWTTEETTQVCSRSADYGRVGQVATPPMQLYSQGDTTGLLEKRKIWLRRPSTNSANAFRHNAS